MSTTPKRTTRVGAAVRGVLGTTIAVPLLFSAMPAAAQSQQQQMQELRQQIQELQGRFNDLQAQQQRTEQRAEQAEQAAAETSASDDDASGFKVGNTTIELTGYIKADAVYGFEDDYGASLGPSDAIGTRLAEGTDSPGDETLGATVKQTRLKLATTTPTALGDLGGYIEMDFYGRGDFGFDTGPQPRVRRAYLTLGNWLIGRDWSTFSDFNYGTMLNFYGPQAQLFERQAQVRYTFDLSEDSSLDVALEAPQGQGFFGPDDNNVANVGFGSTADSNAIDDTDQPLPDFTFRYKAAPTDSFSFQFAGVARKLQGDVLSETVDADGNTVASYGFDSGEESTFAWGLDAGASWSLPTGTTLMATVSGGEGIAKYIYAPAGAPDGYVTSDGDLEPIRQWGFIGTISQDLAEKWTTNLVYGQAYSEDPDDAAFDTGDLHDESSSLAVNLLYTPVDPFTVGIEYNHVDYEQQNGLDADADTVQASAIYNF
ncbi:DcaP family trimeric outer membrane transporter [Salinisphaera orenii]|uniref:Porin n=1 Tax=Salinisphaera orenii YIM 95161 TaxID=1051139 RepID=A0A423PJL1_9GAMM|nr:DcaP family trimeric outer membrane transporter [Salinisphaera halophila]ROO25784.1 hypothetical protein SAHL_13655 [Salinisphaera halophila YIM 95161]